MSAAESIGAIGLSPSDNVATVLRAIAAGEVVWVRCDQDIARITAAEDVPLCHKISVQPITSEEAVVKYGQPIGRALAPIAQGHHVHVHNMRSSRARGQG